MFVVRLLTPYLYIIAVWVIIATILQWSINTLSSRLDFTPVNFYEVSAALIIIIFIASIIRYAYTRKESTPQ